jgi:hypothetical protein
MSSQIDHLLKEFGESERERLGALMPNRKITSCADETFFHEKMMMVFMEATSGFILAEQEEEKRDAVTWEKVIKTALKGLNVELIQVTGDEAGGLTSAVTNLLGIHKSSDLFHIQQDITKGLTSHLARRTERAEVALKKSLEEKETKLQEFREKLGIPGVTIEDTFHLKKIQRFDVLSQLIYECDCLEYDMQGHLLKSRSPACQITYAMISLDERLRFELLIGNPTLKNLIRLATY